MTATVRYAPAGWRGPAIVLPVLLLIVIAGWILQSLRLPSARLPCGAGGGPTVTTWCWTRFGGRRCRSDGRGFTLLSREPRTCLFPVRGEAAVRARYVDSETGQVTISHVYAQ